MQKPILAICLGFQMLFTSSEEFKNTKGLNILTGKISNNQTLIFDLCHFGQSMCKKNLGIEFAYEISNSILS